LFQHLEAQLLEEPLVLARPEPLLKTLLQLLADDGPLRGVLDRLSGHKLLELKVEPVPGGHEVRVVDGLDEGLDLGALGNLALGHGTGNLEWRPVNAGNDGVGVGAAGSALIEVPDNHSLVAGEPAAEDDDDLSGLDETHL